MGIRKLLVVGGCTALIVLLCGDIVAQERQVYRYTDVDGRIVYSDRAPTSGAKDVSTKRVVGNTIETSGMGVAMQQATDRFPVTLFTFACGPACDNAEALLNRRGVPFESLNVEDGENAKKLQALTGELSAPVLKVGDKLVQKGFNEASWNTTLDQAGYPKTPARRSQQPPRPLSEPTAAGRKAIQSEALPAAPQAASGYPK